MGMFPDDLEKKARELKRKEKKEQEQHMEEVRRRIIKERREQWEAEQLARFEGRGPEELNTQMICPHCQRKGCVRTKRVLAFKGISGGKLTAALLTCGLSLLFFGLSKKEEVTKATCDNCKMTWQFS